MPRIVAAAAALLAITLAVLAADPAYPSEAPPGTWWKGNTHTHTLWSDGDAPPEVAAGWYAQRGYNFLVLSDHNVLSRGDRWVRVGERAQGGRVTPALFERYRESLGADALETREREGVQELRLRTLEEVRAEFEVPGEFMMIEGEEITDAYQGLPVHINAINLATLITPRGGESVAATAQNDLDAIAQQERDLGRPILAHINHPNFGWAFTVEDLAQLRGERFFEVYNGHPSVRNSGDDLHPSTEQLWDRALTERLHRLDLPPLFGIACDDAHNYWEMQVGKSNPGRGWLMVRAEDLSPGAILAAMDAGDFYGTSGVVLRDIRVDSEHYLISIDAEPGVTYTTRFMGTRLRPDGTPASSGVSLAVTDTNPAVYEYRGNELYVRAVVTSSREHPNPGEPGEVEQAWLQPYVPARR